MRQTNSERNWGRELAKYNSTPLSPEGLWQKPLSSHLPLTHLFCPVPRGSEGSMNPQISVAPVVGRCGRTEQRCEKLRHWMEGRNLVVCVTPCCVWDTQLCISAWNQPHRLGHSGTRAHSPCSRLTVTRISSNRLELPSILRPPVLHILCRPELLGSAQLPLHVPEVPSACGQRQV